MPIVPNNEIWRQQLHRFDKHKIVKHNNKKLQISTSKMELNVNTYDIYGVYN